MNSRERFLACMRFQPVDRPFRWETLGMWPETLDRWYSEGLDPCYRQPLPGDRGAIRADEFQRALVHEFSLERIDYLREVAVSGYTDPPFCPAFERQVIRDEGMTRVVLDVDGILKREFVRYGTSSMPQFLRFPVACRDDFLALLPRLDPDHPRRLSLDWEEQCTFYRERDFPVGMTVCGAFGYPRNLMGVEALCMAYYDQPSLIHEMLEQWTEFYCHLASRVYAGIRFDFLLIWEDMSYKGGPLISPRLVGEFMLPYYRRLIDHVRGLGCDVIIVDSDGDVRQLVPLFLSAGMNAMFPFEVQAGMDVRQFRKQYGKNLAMMGGLDKRLLNQPVKKMEEELAAVVKPMLMDGGYIPALDHTVPPDVSLESFRSYLKCVRHISGGEDD